MKGINLSDPDDPDRVVDALGRIHIPRHEYLQGRSRKDCNRCSLDKDFESCLKASCKHRIYRQLPPQDIIRI